MITQFHLENFKSYRKVTLSLAPLTLLIGANASGKSNVIEGLRLLSVIASGRYLDEIIRTLQQKQTIRGRLQDLIYTGERLLTLGCSLDSTLPWSELSIMLDHTDSTVKVWEESITSAKDYLYKVLEFRDLGFRVQYQDFGDTGSSNTIACSNNQAVFFQLTTPTPFHPSHKKAQEQIPQVTQKFRLALEQITFLDPKPLHMRKYSSIVNKNLFNDGTNLSSTLYSLCEQGHKELVLDFVRSLPEQDIRDIQFIHTPRDEVMVQLTESFGGQARQCDAPNLSDGTLRVLAIAAALLSAKSGSLVVIEEIDNGVHPSRAKTLLQNIQHVAEMNQLHVLITSHNPALLDALPLQAIPNVVACYRDPQQGDSRLVRLQDMPDYPELIAQGPVGSLMTRGILERYLKRLSTRSPEQKMHQALVWLEALQAEETAK